MEFVFCILVLVIVPHLAALYWGLKTKRGEQ